MLTAAIFLLTTCLIYHQVTTLVDFYPLNNVRDSNRRERIREVLINGPVMLAPVLLAVFGGLAQQSSLVLVAGGIELVIAALGITLWWLPYLTGHSVPWAARGTDGTWPQLHARVYASTVMILPNIDNRPRPNLEHTILHALLVAAGICSLLAARTV
jgi:hypothetical protein